MMLVDIEAPTVPAEVLHFMSFFGLLLVVCATVLQQADNSELH